MNETIRQSVTACLAEKGVPVIGAASAAAYNAKAPAGFRPEDMLPGAKTMLILARPLPLAVFQTPKNNLFYSFYGSSFHTYYTIMNDAANAAALVLEKAGYPSLPIPSYSPLRFVDGDPRGLISLKHAAVEAGLGKMGKNTLLIHPEYGNVLRLGGLLTTAEWDCAGPGEFKKLCPEGCELCRKACPVGALSANGIDKTKCMGNCVKHTLMPPGWVLSLLRQIVRRSRFMTSFMELFTLSFFDNYGIGCFACLTACPHFPGNRKQKRPE